MPLVPLELIIRVNGFERSYNLYSNTTGEFTYSFQPLSGESGMYEVSCVHPDLLERPTLGEFTIELDWAYLKRKADEIEGEGGQHIMSTISQDRGQTWSPQRYRLPLRVTACDKLERNGRIVQMFWGIDKPKAADGRVFFSFTKIGRYFLALHGRADFAPRRCNAPWVSAVVEADGFYC